MVGEVVNSVVHPTSLLDVAALAPADLGGYVILYLGVGASRCS